MSSIIIIGIGILSWLTFSKIIDPNFLVFFLATALGYIMGFLTRYFIHN